MKSLFLTVITCLFIMPGVTALGQSAWTTAYVLVADQSTVTQTGGIAGVERTYRVKGRFALTVDAEQRTASFAQVDANLVDPAGLEPDRGLDGVFNLTGLAGTIIDDTSIRFQGVADDGSDVVVTLVFQDGRVQLKGETVPPPNSADFFLFALDAAARPASSLPRSGRYVFAPGQSTVTRTGGIAGITKVYTIKGRFRLRVARESGAASFVQVNARLVDSTGLEAPRRLEEVFNLTRLAGVIGDDESVRFTGRADDGSEVAISLVFRGRHVALTGQTTPPPNSADFFLYALDATARRR